MSSMISTTSIFRDVYGIIFKTSLTDNFVYARRYEELTVLKQFTPYYKDKLGELTGFVLAEHIKKYGNSLIISGTRIPYNDYEIIDRRSIPKKDGDDDTDKIIQHLFSNGFIAMGFVDIPGKIKIEAEKYKQHEDKASV